ncbi:MAG: YciI family protein [Nocardioides sp.]|nr:YciI family protein [Nocardioides sp.]
MTQYLLSVHHGPADDQVMAEMTPDAMQALFASVDAFNTDLKEKGAWVLACGLEPIEASTTVDNTGDAPILTDGPFVESKEYLGGFWVIQAADLDAALAWATQASRACAGKVEVRPLQGE